MKTRAFQSDINLKILKVQLHFDPDQVFVVRLLIESAPLMSSRIVK